MARVLVAGRMKRGFAKWRGDNAAYPFFQCPIGGKADGLIRGFSCLGIQLSDRDTQDVIVAGFHAWEHTWVRLDRIKRGHNFERNDSNLSFEQRNGPSQDFGVTKDDRTRRGMNLSVLPSADDHLRTDTGRVAHCDCEN
jgi:hypothetical protein